MTSSIAGQDLTTPPGESFDQENDLMHTRHYGLATATPPSTATQRHSHTFMSRVIEARESEYERERGMLFLDAIHESCGIDRRYSVIEDFTRSDPEEFTFFPKNWRLDPFPTTAQRMALFEPMSITLAEEAARGALGDARIPTEAVTHLIVTTCTGLYAPGPDILLVKRLGLRPTTRRTVIGFMGCYGAFNGLRMADQILGAEPDAVVLQVCVELCSLHYQVKLEPHAIIGNCLFGDGCAAAVYARPGRFEGGYRDVVTTHCEITHDSLDQMQWHIGDHGFDMILDVEVPRTLLAGGAAFVSDLLRLAGRDKKDIDAWVIHPGGPRIVDAVRDAAELSEAQVSLSRSVLRDYGNMSSATTLFVLERQLKKSPHGGDLVMLGFGPGLTMEGAVLAGI
ncbi:MAG: type III polyketide synthase [Bradymonadaceae bacterium]